MRAFRASQRWESQIRRSHHPLPPYPWSLCLMAGRRAQRSPLSQWLPTTPRLEPQPPPGLEVLLRLPLSSGTGCLCAPLPGPTYLPTCHCLVRRLTLRWHGMVVRLLIATVAASPFHFHPLRTCPSADSSHASRPVLLLRAAVPQPATASPSIASSALPLATTTSTAVAQAGPQRPTLHRR